MAKRKDRASTLMVPGRPNTGLPIPVSFACTCEVCPEAGLPCTNLAPDNEDLCDECAMGIHESERDGYDA
jgi:hypothetical protein